MQTISLKSKKTIRFIVITLIAALTLLGVTPSFADKTEKIIGEETIKPSAVISWDDAPPVEGTSAILVNADNGDILFEKNAYELRNPASITKIVTCMVVLETMNLDDIITVDHDIVTEGTGIDIKKGETFTVEQLLYALMLDSANDAAEVLAVAAGGTIENFCEMMNERAERCGAVNTNFLNPHGLNGKGYENHYTTAYDLVLISQEAMKNETFRKIVSTYKYEIPETSVSPVRKLKNSNGCLAGKYKYAGTLGIKTGYTSSAGRCFCGWAKRGETNLIAITLNSTTHDTRFEDVISLWDYGFEKYYTYEAVPAGKNLGEIKVKRGETGKVNVAVLKDIDLTLNDGYNKKGISTEVVFNEKKVYAPIKKGDELGVIKVYKDNELVAKEPVCAVKNVDKGMFLSYIGIPDDKILLFIGILAGILLLILILTWAYRKNKHRKKLKKRAKINRNIRRREWEKEKNPFD